MVGTKAKQKNAGFTIVELIVVIAVIAVLVSIVILSYNGWRTSVATNSLKSDLGHAASAMESARSFDNGYPTSIPTTFSASANNTIALKTNDPKSFCIDGTTSTSASIKYYIDTTIQSKGPASGTCATRTSLPVPAQIASLTTPTARADEIDTAWTLASPNYATQYTVQCAQDQAFITNVISQTVTNGTDTATTISGATPLSTYYCRIRAENTNGQSAWSAASKIDTPTYTCADSGLYGTYPDCYDIN